MCGASVGVRERAAAGRSNCHLYHYAGNNPVRYVDPKGYFSFSFGWTASAGGSGGQAGVTSGIVIAYSKEYGITFGHFSSASFGFMAGEGASIGPKITFDKNAKKVETGVSKTSDIGGSVTVYGASIGGEVSRDLDTENLSVSGSLCTGAGSIAEAHMMTSVTYTEDDTEKMRLLSEQIDYASGKINRTLTEFNEHLEDMYIDYCMEQYEYLFF